MKDYADDFLRWVVGNFIAEEICNWKAIARIRRQLSSILADRLESLGYVIDLDSGVLIKKVIPPKEFLEIALEAKRRDLIANIAEETPKDVPETIPADGTVEADQVSDHTELNLIRQERMISLQQQLAIHRKNLSWLEEQAARHGMDVPTRLLNEMDWEREAITRINAKLERLRGRA